MTLSSRCLCVSSACLCGSGWTSWGTLTSSLTSTWRRWWTLRCTSSHRPSWTPAPRRSTSWAEWASIRSKSAMFVTLWMSLREKRSGPFFDYNHNYPLQFLWFQQFPAILNQICDPFIYQLSEFLFWTQEKNLRAPESQMMSTFCRHLKCIKVDIWLCTLTARWISVIAEATRDSFRQFMVVKSTTERTLKWKSHYRLSALCRPPVDVFLVITVNTV